MDWTQHRDGNNEDDRVKFSNDEHMPKRNRHESDCMKDDRTIEKRRKNEIIKAKERKKKTFR